jgi:hypothetical protein
MRILLIFIALLVSPGCTSVALKRATVAHAESSTDLRYREVMENLAMIAANPAALPAYSSIYAGTTDVNDIVKATSTSVWSRMALQHPLRYVSFFSTETADFMGSRAVKSNWTLDPTVVPEKLRAMRAACNLVLLGPEHVGPDGQYLQKYQPAEYEEDGHGINFQLLNNVDKSKLPNDPSTIIVYVPVTIKPDKTVKKGLTSIRIVGDNKETIIDGAADILGIKTADLMRRSQAYQYYNASERYSFIQSIIIALGKKKPVEFQKKLAEFLGKWHSELVLRKENFPDGNYFEVEEELLALGSGWLHQESCWKDVPWDACYKAGCGDKFVWVGDDGMASLSQFLLILQRIARMDFGTTFYPKPVTRTVQKNFDFTMFGQNYHALATFNLDQDGFLTPGAGQPAVPFKVRTDNVGANADLKSVINAAAKSSSP